MRPLLIRFPLRKFPIRPRSHRPSTRSSRFELELLEGRELCTVATAATPPTVVSLQRFGVHGAPVQLVVTFSQPMDPLRASNPANYLLSSTSLDHRYFTALNLTTDLITSATYDLANQTVTLTPVKRLPLNRGQELIVNGQPGGLANQQGVLLDGNSTGKPGSNYIAIFGGLRSLKPILTNGASPVLQLPTPTVGRDRMTGFMTFPNSP
jgi:hypothetical protein